MASFSGWRATSEYRSVPGMRPREATCGRATRPRAISTEARTATSTCPGFPWRARPPVPLRLAHDLHAVLLDLAGQQVAPGEPLPQADGHGPRRPRAGERVAHQPARPAVG